MSDFTKIIVENTDWLYLFVRKLVKSDHAAEEVVQETFYRAYKNYSGYTDQGKIRAWLCTIARNAAYRYYNVDKRMIWLSSSGDDEDGSFFDTLAADETTPEEQALYNELVARVLQLIANLPERQRTAVTLRYIDNLSISEASQAMSLPVGTVKSNAHYGLVSLRKQLGILPDKTPTKEVTPMKTCMDFYGELFEYAKGFLSAEERAEIKAHIEKCPECANIVSALTALWPYLQKNVNAENCINHFNVCFQIAEDLEVGYVGMSSDSDKKTIDKHNALVEKNGGVLKGEFGGGGRGKIIKKLSSYIDNGQKIDYVTREQGDGIHVSDIYTSMPKLSLRTWHYSAFLKDEIDNGFGWCIKQSELAPNLYEANMRNDFGSAVHTAFFIPLPEGATNIRFKRGSGILELGEHRFAFAQRFAAQNERMELEFTFNK